MDIVDSCEEQVMRDVHFYAYLKSDGVAKVEIRFKQP